MNVSLEVLLIILCSLIVLSYFFSNSQPVYQSSFRALAFIYRHWFSCHCLNANNFHFSVPAEIVEGLGVVGLIMIVLEAGLDLEPSKNKFAHPAILFCSPVDSYFFSSFI